jgi:hypothetical protein
MECKRDVNLENCTCSAGGCPRQGICCDCVQYHLRNRQLPGCFFSPEAERTYDRSFEHFAQLVTAGKM